MRRTLFDELIRVATEDERIWLLYADVGYSYVEDFERLFPERTVNCGIREQLMVGMAAGLALEGKLPYCYSMATFITRRAYEQIAVDVAEPNLPVTLIGIDSPTDAGFSHTAKEDAAIMHLLPNIGVYVPRSEETLLAAMRNSAPKYLRVGRL